MSPSLLSISLSSVSTRGRLKREETNMIDLNLTLEERLQPEPLITLWEMITGTITVAFGFIAVMVLGVILWAIM